MALRIPVLPIPVEGLPGEMIQQIHALRMNGQDPNSLAPHLSKDIIEGLVEKHAYPAMPCTSVRTCRKTGQK